MHSAGIMRVVAYQLNPEVVAIVAPIMFTSSCAVRRRLKWYGWLPLAVPCTHARMEGVLLWSPQPALICGTLRRGEEWILGGLTPGASHWPADLVPQLGRGGSSTNPRLLPPSSRLCIAAIDHLPSLPALLPFITLARFSSLIHAPEAQLHQ